MAEYINRELADLLLKQRAEVYAKVEANYALTIIQGDRAVIHTIAKADVRENVNGEWRSIIAKNIVLVETDGYVRRAVECSVCGQYLIGSGEYSVYGRFCPCCGSKMRGENDE